CPEESPGPARQTSPPASSTHSETPHESPRWVQPLEQAACFAQPSEQASSTADTPAAAISTHGTARFSWLPPAEMSYKVWHGIVYVCASTACVGLLGHMALSAHYTRQLPVSALRVISPPLKKAASHWRQR